MICEDSRVGSPAISIDRIRTDADGDCAFDLFFGDPLTGRMNLPVTRQEFVDCLLREFANVRPDCRPSVSPGVTPVRTSACT